MHEFSITRQFLVLTLFAASAACLASTPSAPFPSDSASAFTLGIVTVVGHNPAEGVTALDADDFARHTRQRLGQAIDLLPGITLRDAGARNEGIFYLRGFDQRRVPIFIDGAPVYVPYDGTVDVSRFATGAFGRVTVEKSMPSLLLGGNAMGGAVNLVSRRPQHRFEIEGEVSTLWDGRLNAGVRRQKFYVQAGATFIDRSCVRLPKSFRPIPDVQPDRRLRNSDTRDFQFNSRVGFTPNDVDEYAIGYSMIRARKGVPAYLGNDGRQRWWRYRDWDKDGVLFHSRTRLSPTATLATRLFYDRYYNDLASFDDMNCNSQDSKSAFTSIYNDFSAGAMASAELRLPHGNTLKAGATWKADVHRSHNVGEPVARQTDHIWSVAVEDRWRISDAWSATAGLGLFGRKGTKAQSYDDPTGGKDYHIVDNPLTSDTELNFQAAADYRFAAGQHIRLSGARTSRFATLSERYSYKFGKSIPNPALRSERAFNLDLTYDGTWRGFSWSVSGFWSFLDNVIQDVTGVDPDDPLVWQPRNAGRAQFRGWEVSVGWTLADRVTLRGSYSYVDRVNTTDRSLRFTDVPRHKGVVTADWRIWRGLNVDADFTAVSSAVSRSDGGGRVAGFALFNGSVGYAFLARRLTVRVGVKNLFDRLYSYTEGYPQEGRRFYASVMFDFNIR